MHKLNEVFDLAIVLRIVDGELELCLGPALGARGVSLRSIGNSIGSRNARPQFHAATGADTLLVRADVGVHWALVDHILRVHMIARTTMARKRLSEMSFHHGLYFLCGRSAVNVHSSAILSFYDP